MRIVGIGNIHLAVEVSSYYSEILDRIIDCKPYNPFIMYPHSTKPFTKKISNIISINLLQTENHTAKP